ncbi:hypothetical protein [Phragmitibacter flavus]|uniref:hypothetical protein n=1 Tax=Phragmitibacter flavus TaxID=2576071 RepID=UPI00140E430A|nr:hypothetical protein [Phragmitibacter flavus]
MKPNSFSISSRKKAFTLVETVLALGVAAVSMSAIFGLLPVGLNCNQSSTEQTSAANLLTVLAADLRSTPGSTSTSASTEAETHRSNLFEIDLPAKPTGSTEPTQQTLHIGDDLQPTSELSLARYQLNLWVVAPATDRAPTTVRALITWPANATYQKAIGSLETMIALDRH